MPESAPDRVWFSAGKKINKGNYESLDLNAGYTTDVRPDETPKQAMARAYRFVQETIEAAEKKAIEAL